MIEWIRPSIFVVVSEGLVVRVERIGQPVPIVIAFKERMSWLESVARSMNGEDYP